MNFCLECGIFYIRSNNIKKTQNRKVKAVLSDYETLSKKYNISTKTISRMLKKDNTFEKADNNIPLEDDYDYDDEANDFLEWFYS